MKWIKARYYRDIRDNFKVYVFSVWGGYIFKVVSLSTQDDMILGRKRIINPDYRSFDNFTNRTVVRDYMKGREKEKYPLKIKKEDLVWLLKISYTTKKCECSNTDIMEKLIEKLENYD